MMKTLLKNGVQVYLTTAISLCSFFSFAQSNGLDYLGKGYDIFGKYADPSSVKERLLRVDDPDIISTKNISSKDIETFEGSSISELSQTYNNQVGLNIDALIFKVGIETDFSGSTDQKLEQYFTSINDVTITSQVQYAIDPSYDIQVLKDMLHPMAKRYLNDVNYPIENLFQKYGTHYLFDIKIGASARYTSTTNSSTKIDASAVKLALTGEYKKLSGGASTEQTETQKMIISNTRSKLYAIGGNSEGLQSINDKDQYKEWASGIRTNSVLCALDKNSLRPIWELCENKERANAIKNYFYNVYIKKFPLPVNMKALDNGVFKSAFIQQVFKGNFTGQSENEYLTVDIKNGITLHYGSNLKNSVNLMPYESTLNGVDFSVQSGGKVLHVDKMDGKQMFTIIDNNFNTAIYSIVKSGSSYTIKNEAELKAISIQMLNKENKNHYFVFMQLSGVLMQGLNDSDEVYELDVFSALKQYNSGLINSISKIGDVNNDLVEDLYIVCQNGHFIVALEKGSFKIIKAVTKGNLLGNAYEVNSNDFATNAGRINSDDKADIFLTDGNTIAIITAANGGVNVDSKYYRSTTFASIGLSSNAEYIGSVDVDQDGISELIFATDLGSSRKYQIIDISKNKIKFSKTSSY